MASKYVPTIKDLKAGQRFQQKQHVQSKFIRPAPRPPVRSVATKAPAQETRETSGVEPRRIVGKFRGRVVDNIDPLRIGRVAVEVPALPGAKLNWALPCVPVNLPARRGSALPPIGAQVWVEFEAGDLNRPIWNGCFYTDAEETPPALLPVTR